MSQHDTAYCIRKDTLYNFQRDRKSEISFTFIRGVEERRKERKRKISFLQSTFIYGVEERRGGRERDRAQALII